MIFLVGLMVNLQKNLIQNGISLDYLMAKVVKKKKKKKWLKLKKKKKMKNRKKKKKKKMKKNLKKKLNLMEKISHGGIFGFKKINNLTIIIYLKIM